MQIPRSERGTDRERETEWEGMRKGEERWSVGDKETQTKREDKDGSEHRETVQVQAWEEEHERQREGSEAGRGVRRLQLAEGFPEPTASVVELLNNFTGLSERSFKVATWPGQHSRAEQQALLGLCAHAHTFVRRHSYTHKRKQDSTRQLLTGTRVSRAINLRMCVCVCVC